VHRLSATFVSVCRRLRRGVGDAAWALTEPARRGLYAGHRRWIHWRRRVGDALWAARDAMGESWRQAGLRRRAAVGVLAAVPFATATGVATFVLPDADRDRRVGPAKPKVFAPRPATPHQGVTTPARVRSGVNSPAPVPAEPPASTSADPRALSASADPPAASAGGDGEPRAGRGTIEPVHSPAPSPDRAPEDRGSPEQFPEFDLRVPPRRAPADPDGGGDESGPPANPPPPRTAPPPAAPSPPPVAIEQPPQETEPDDDPGPGIEVPAPIPPAAGGGGGNGNGNGNGNGRGNGNGTGDGDPP
jgi:hypothetical protein